MCASSMRSDRFFFPFPCLKQIRFSVWVSYSAVEGAASGNGRGSGARCTGPSHAEMSIPSHGKESKCSWSLSGRYVGGYLFVDAWFIKGM